MHFSFEIIGKPAMNHRLFKLLFPLYTSLSTDKNRPLFPFHQVIDEFYTALPTLSTKNCEKVVLFFRDFPFPKNGD
ncbi:hypothetical protein B1222_14450 [Paenibacillus larvae subsp. pulvifaciens]|nr:hypothetical protein B1222_14450 [Paenibacillus larvae subsp. pulvifaciens]AQZ47333.1 hypothetical protein B5S25_12805 [Paenibacillus larvae subsp. pulvifaciens]MBH0343153.1 hypothetical protein [Paenibacillus larvae]